MEYVKVRNLLKEPSILAKRESAKLARNTVLLTIAVTSVIWLLLDVFLFYSSGFMSMQQTLEDDFTMPTNRRSVNNGNKSLLVPLTFKKSDETPGEHSRWNKNKLLDRLRTKNEHGGHVINKLLRPFNESARVVNKKINTIRDELNKTARAYQEKPVKYEKVGFLGKETRQ